jgi:hypothetical protein
MNCFRFVSILSVGLALLPTFMFKYFMTRHLPIPNEIALEIQKFDLPLPSVPPARKFEEPVGYPRFVFQLEFQFVNIVLSLR